MNLEKVTVARADGNGQVGHFRSPSADTYLQLNVNVELNRTYTLHGYIKSAANGTLSCLGKSVVTTASWNHFSMQIVPDSKIFCLVFSPGEYWFYNFKLEKGTIMTQWSPNGEDLVVVKQNIVSMGSSINQLNDKITQKVWMTEVNAAKGEVDAHLTNVEQTAKKIDWLVKSGTDSSNMVLTDNAYSLIAKNIDLKGNATFSSFLDTNKTYINGGKIATGSITADQIAADAITADKISVSDLSSLKATIGGWTISDTGISNDFWNEYDKISYTISLNTPDAADSKVINLTKNNDSQFYIMQSGKMYAKNADISGTITSASINNGNGAFTVDKDGKVSASNLNMSGGSIALKGNLSNSTIDLKATDNSGNNYELWMNGAVLRIVKNDENLITLYGTTGSIGAQTMYAQEIQSDKFRESAGGYAMCGDTTEHTFHCNWDGTKLWFEVDNTWVWNSSDKRLKKNIQSIQDEYICAIGAVDLVQYNLNRENYSDKELYFGAIAQDVVAELESRGLNDENIKLLTKKKVSDDSNELYYGMDYEQFLLLRLAGDEQRIVALEQQISKLKEQI